MKGTKGSSLTMLSDVVRLGRGCDKDEEYQRSGK